MENPADRTSVSSQGAYPQERSGPPSLPEGAAPWLPFRFIIIKVTPGEDVEVDFDGVFGWWEAKAALERALELLEEGEVLSELGEDEDD